MWKRFIINYFVKKLPERLTSTKLLGAVLAWLSIKAGIPEDQLAGPIQHILAGIAQAVPILWWMFTQAKVDAAEKVANGAE